MQELIYSQNGDYLIPNLTLEEPEQKPLGKYALMCRNHLQQHRKLRYNRLLLSGDLTSYLHEIDRAVRSRIELTMAALAIKNPPPSKASDPMKWQAHMNSLHHQAEELALNELMFS